MVRGVKRRVRGLTALALLIALGGVAGGCVYWRLYRVRGQLARFDEYFTVRNDPGPVIEAREPVLKAGDIEWLTGLGGEPVEASGRGGGIVYRLWKRNPPAGEAPRYREIPIHLWLEKGRVSAFEFPETFNELINRELLRRVFQAVDQGELDRGSGQTEWELHSDLEVPDRRRVLAVAGEAGQVDQTEMHRVDAYAYDLGEPRPTSSAAVSARFVYDRETDQVVQTTVTAGRLHILVERGEAGRYRATLRREQAEGP